MRLCAGLPQTQSALTLALADSYHRTRLQKIQKLCFYLLATEEAFECMTENEQTYCQGFANLTQRHFEQSFLKGLPATLRRIDKVSISA